MISCWKFGNSKCPHKGLVKKIKVHLQDRAASSNDGWSAYTGMKRCSLYSRWRKLQNNMVTHCIGTKKYTHIRIWRVFSQYTKKLIILGSRCWLLELYTIASSWFPLIFYTRGIYYSYTKKDQKKINKEYPRNIRKKNVNIKHLEMDLYKICILFEKCTYTFFLKLKTEIWG